MPAKVSNPRDLLLQLLGDLLYVERRLAGGVLRELADSVSDERLRRGWLRISRDSAPVTISRCSPTCP